MLAAVNDRCMCSRPALRQFRSSRCGGHAPVSCLHKKWTVLCPSRASMSF